MRRLKKDRHIYTAIRTPEERSQIEELLYGDGFDVSSFATAAGLWERFKARPGRFVITDQRFREDFKGLDLVRYIREFFVLPYVYVLMRSPFEKLKEIEEGLGLGVDDYIIKPHNPFQIRSRVLVGLRWISYIDSIKPSGNIAAPHTPSE